MEHGTYTKDELLSRVIEVAIEDDANSRTIENPTCWSPLKDDEFIPAYQTVSTIPAGLYEIGWNAKEQVHCLKKQSMLTDELYELPSPEIEDILKDIDFFWQRKEIYEKYNFVHKRGILLYGEPGCGKSGLIQLCIKNIIDNKNGIVINIKEEEEVKYFSEFVSTLRKIEPNRPLIVVLEDLDSLADDEYSTTNLLNILDGIKQIQNVVYLATTNYPEKLQERITNRPSRFDRRYEITMPNKEVRRAYLQSKLSAQDLDRIDLNEWIKLTDGMSLSHIKELVISVIVMDRRFDEAILQLTNLKKKPKINRAGNVGFR